MGQHRHNPMAEGYEGPLPPAILGSEIATVIQPSKKFLEMVEPILKEAREKGQPEPQIQFTDADKDVVFVLRGAWMVPMRTMLAGQRGAPAAKIEICELARIPFLDFKRRVAAAFRKENPALVGTLGLEETEAAPSLLES